MKPEPIIDTHQHLIDLRRWPYTWAAGMPALAGKNFDYAAFAAAAAGTGIAGTLFMETTPDDPHWRGEAKAVHELSEEPDSMIIGLIARARLEEEPAQVRKYLDSIASDDVVGIRRILHVEADGLSATPAFRANLTSLGGRGLTFDLCVRGDQIPIAIELARSAPRVQFILDHCGMPAVAKNETEPWRSRIKAIAACPNVACKISGLAGNALPGQMNAATMGPYIQHCIDCFGWERVVWGSDWPVCHVSSDLAGWVGVTREVLSGASVDQRARLLSRNAIEIYGLQRFADKLARLGLL